MKLWVDPITGKKYMDKLEDFDYDNQKDFETKHTYDEAEEEEETGCTVVNDYKKKQKSSEYIKSREQEMIEMRKRGKTIRFISQQLEISDAVVRRIVKDVCPPKRMPREVIVSKDKDLVELYKSGLTMQQVSQKINMAYHTVNNRLHELEKLGLVEVRTTHESRKMKMGATV